MRVSICYMCLYDVCCVCSVSESVSVYVSMCLRICVCLCVCVAVCVRVCMVFWAVYGYLYVHIFTSRTYVMCVNVLISVYMFCLDSGVHWYLANVFNPGTTSP